MAIRHAFLDRKPKANNTFNVPVPDQSMEAYLNEWIVFEIEKWLEVSFMDYLLFLLTMTCKVIFMMLWHRGIKVWATESLQWRWLLATFNFEMCCVLFPILPLALLPWEWVLSTLNPQEGFRRYWCQSFTAGRLNHSLWERDFGMRIF